MLYSQQCCLYWFLPPSPLPTLCPSTWGVPEVSIIHTFLAAHITPQARPRLGQWGLVSAPALASLCLAHLLAHPSLSHSARLHKDSSCRDKSRQKPAQATAWGLTEPQQPVHMGPGFAWTLLSRLCPLTTKDTITWPGYSRPFLWPTGPAVECCAASHLGCLLCRAGGKRNSSAYT